VGLGSIVYTISLSYDLVGAASVFLFYLLFLLSLQVIISS